MKHWTDMSSGWHENYERGRPGYPAQVVRVPVVPTSASVLEVGAGTGKLTRLLVDAYAVVLALEPDPTMRRWCDACCPQAMLIAGTAEQLPLADRSVDAVFSAEAFHWFAHDRALADFARVLRPGGSLVLAWNRPDGGVEPSIAAVEELLEPYWPDAIEMPLDLDPRQFEHARDWPLAFARSPFEPLQEVRLTNTQTVDREGLPSSAPWAG
ncbi:MAG TPA: class I SAM-dependent methyltransferase [Gemmatimonadaceae bacterium]|nr:class I SAM-dependent methyltransferase [Gemmatimonadaceae bacterium]